MLAKLRVAAVAVPPVAAAVDRLAAAAVAATPGTPAARRTQVDLLVAVTLFTAATPVEL